MERRKLAGFIRRPSIDDIRRLAEMEYLHPDARELEELHELADAMLGMFDRLDELPQPELSTRYTERDKGRRPTPEEDPCNAFIRKCLVKGAPTGKLAGKTVGLKDNIRLAGVPMTNGSRLLQHYVPDIDATVVERLLDAGATIVGKLNMDDFGFAGTSETSAYGCIRNPHHLDFSAGGSSGGSGAAVAAGAVDLALAVDQGGSGRIPASWCGVVGIKPTHGLVPSFGITYLDHTVDFVCPLARSVAEVALALEVIAGDDPKDPQWTRGTPPVVNYSDALERSVAGLRIGVVKEGVAPETLEADVADAFGNAVNTLESMGAQCREVNLPFWPDAQAIWNGFAAHAITAMIESEQEGYGRRGFCDIGWQEAFANARRVGSDGFPPTLKALMVIGKYLRREYRSLYFSKATNLRFAARQQVDRLLDEVDLLLTPTTPMKAFRLLTEPLSLKAMAARASSMCQNTYPLNVTGHPAISVPVGFGEHHLPIGLQMIGRYFSEPLLLGTAHALEQAMRHQVNG
ncbi:MAG: amidase family protein [Gammaproteobacteria bacterium]